MCQSVTYINLPCDKLIGLTTDEAPAMCGDKNRLVGRIQAKMHEENFPSELAVYHCIIHQESLFVKVIRMEHAMKNVVQIVNFIRATGLNHRQFQSFLWNIDSEFVDIP